MSTISSDDFGSLIAFASQLIFVVNDWLSKPGKRCASQSQVIAHAHECTFLRSMTHCGSVMDSLPEDVFDHKDHRRCDEQWDCIETWSFPFHLLYYTGAIYRHCATFCISGKGETIYVFFFFFFFFFCLVEKLNEPPHDKPTKWHERPAKNQISQADLSLRWAHSHFVSFVMRRLILRNNAWKWSMKSHWNDIYHFHFLGNVRLTVFVC